MKEYANLKIIAFDIDGTLTDGKTWWAGESIGWVQRYSTRDGEALIRIAKHMNMVPISRNKTRTALLRMEQFGFETRWLGTTDKKQAVVEVTEFFGVSPTQICFIGDGKEDAEIFHIVGFGIAVADAHPSALEAADHVTKLEGGNRVMEELEFFLQNRNLI